MAAPNDPSPEPPGRLRAYLLSAFLSLAVLFYCGAGWVEDTGGPFTRIRRWDVLMTSEPASIEINPQVVYSADNTRFTIEAIVRDEKGNVLSGSFPDIEWEVPGEIARFPQFGDSTILTVPLMEWEGGSEQKTIEPIVAKLGNLQSQPGRVVVSSSEPPKLIPIGFRRLKAPHDLDDSPGLFLMDLWMDEARQDDIILAIAETALLGRFQGLLGPYSVIHDGPSTAFFSSSSDAVFSPQPDWTHPFLISPILPTAEVVNRSALFLDSNPEEEWPNNAPSQQPLRLLLWGGMAVGEGEEEDLSDQIDARMEGDAAVAKEILERSRSGINLSWEVVRSGVEGGWEASPSENCNMTPGEAAELFDGYKPGDGTVLVVYAEKFSEFMWGFSCIWDQELFGAVFINSSVAASEHLIHELGHTLGLSWPMDGEGHASSLFGFEDTNPMINTSNMDKWTDVERFTLGQVFRMHYDEKSLLQWGIDTPIITCQNARDEESPCPCACVDVVPWGPVSLVKDCGDYQPLSRRGP